MKRLNHIAGLCLIIFCLILSTKILYASENDLSIFEISQNFPQMSGLQNESPPLEGGHITVGIGSFATPNGILNPLFTSSAIDSAFLSWFSGGSIFSMTPDLRMGQHGIATWEQDINAGSITITLVEDVYWHDGVSLTLDDLVYAFEVIGSYEYQVSGGLNFNDLNQNIVGMWEFFNREADYISGLVLSDDKRELTIYFVDFTPSIQYFGFWTTPYPRHIWQDVPIDEHVFHENSLVSPIGFGSFIVENVDLLWGSITLVRNENFWAGVPYLDSITLIHVLPDWGVDMLYFGDIDILTNVAAHTVEWFPDPENFHFLGSDSNQFSYIAFNLGYFDFDTFTVVTDENARMADVNLRRAMNYAFDFSFLTETHFNGLRIPATSIMTPTHTNFFNPSPESFVYNPERANEILDAAGYSFGEDGWRTFPDGSELTIIFALQEGETLFAEFYQNAWENIGLRVHLHFVGWHKFLSEYTGGDSGEWDVLAGAFQVGANPNPNNLWGNTTFNIPRFTSERFAEHLAGFNSQNAWNEDWLINHYHEWQDLFIEYLPSIPTNWRVNITGVNNRVLNYYIGIAADGIRTIGGLHHIQVSSHNPWGSFTWHDNLDENQSLFNRLVRSRL